MTHAILGNMDGQKFGELIKRKRARAGVKTLDLAYRIGRQQSFISKVESGDIKETPPPSVLAGFEREIGASVMEQLQAMGYRVFCEDGFPYIYEPMVREIAVAVTGLTGSQRDAIWQIVKLLQRDESAA